MGGSETGGVEDVRKVPRTSVRSIMKRPAQTYPFGEENGTYSGRKQVIDNDTSVRKPLLPLRVSSTPRTRRPEPRHRLAALRCVSTLTFPKFELHRLRRIFGTAAPHFTTRLLPPNLHRSSTPIPIPTYCLDQ